ncbi:aminotransferase class III-fold pyridoxal phosphate-dependent enzyme [Paenarthrobacter sp. NPDC089322]|uniref:aminotransferase family protein n=1 Tax=Paenarthrobacter sp. NPDC089322 TaxID=3155065 RepID=UPI003429CF8D
MNTKEGAGPLIQNKVGSSLPLIERAHGVWLVDSLGNEYIDGCSGAVVVNIGHSHPRVLRAMNEQADKVTFVHRGAFVSQAMYDTAAKLSEATGYAGSWFVGSGSEAVEATLQFALQYYREIGEERSWFLSHSHSYHGNTLGALSLSGHARRAVAGQLAYNFHTLPSPYESQDQGGSSHQMDVDALLAGVEAQIRARAGDVAGILFEPVSGATLGANLLPAGYLEGLRGICDKYGILLIADEVMTGMGRTGKMLAVDHWGVRPDLVALGKGLGAGYTPIAATLLNSRVLDAIAHGSGRILGGHTYGGNPLSVAVAREVLGVLLDENLVEASAACGELLAAGLRKIAFRHAIVSETRGLGMLRAVEFHNPGLHVGAVAEMARLEAFKQGLIVYPTTGGFNDACIIAPPLTITENETLELLERLDRAIRGVGDALNPSSA